MLLADRHHGLTEGLRGLLQTAFDAVVMVADEPSLFESAARLQPDVVVVDLGLGCGDGDALAWVGRLRTLCPRAGLLVLSVHDEPTVLRSVREAGADAVVLKREIVTQLMPAIDQLLAARPLRNANPAGSEAMP